MRHMTVQRMWIDGHRVHSEAVPPEEGRVRVGWRHIWPLVFILAMTLLSTFCAHLGDSKAGDATQATQSGISVRTVK